MSHMMRIAVVLALVVVATAAAPPNVRYDRGTLALTQGAKTVRIQVEIARTMEARSQGLMHRPSLAENAGMLFVFDEDGKWGFWMKNTLIPLSIAFIDKDWRVVEILDMKVAPDPAAGPFEIYEPSVAYRYALEVNKGFFERHGITAGARGQLLIAPSPAPTRRP
jgi:uncharacterized membrane protein (UPF0127 family)